MNYNMNYDETSVREEELMENYERLCERNPEKYENMPCYLPEFVKSLDEATYAYDTMRSCWVKVKEKTEITNDVCKELLYHNIEPIFFWLCGWFSYYRYYTQNHWWL